MPDPIELALMLAAAAALPTAGVMIFLYLQSGFRLLEMVKEREPMFWEHLGRPERTHVRSQQGGFSTIQPLGPWLAWVWSGNAALRDSQVARELLRTRTLLRGGLIAFMLAVGVILALVTMTS